MPSLKLLLDRFGVPPKEVCLDWALQLKELHSCEEGCSAQLGWDDVKTDDHGKLSTSTSQAGSSQQSAAIDLVEQLVSWAEGKSDASPVSPGCHDLESRLQRLLKAESTLSLSQPDEEPKAQSHHRSTVGSEFSNLQMSESQTGAADGSQTEAAGDFHANTQNAHANSTATNRVATQSASEEPAIAKTRARHALQGLALLAIVLVALWGAKGLFKGGRQETMASNPIESTNTNMPPTEDEFSAAEPRSEELQTLGEISGFVAETEDEESSNDSVAQTLGDLEIQVDLGAPTTSVSSSRGVGTRNNEEDGSSQREAESVRGETGNGTNGMDEDQAVGDVPSEGAIEDIDLAQELGKVVQLAESNSSEQLLATNQVSDSATAETLQLPPMTIPMFPMLQTYTLDAKAGQRRVRSPVWQLSIAAREGFTVSPSEPQSIQGKQVVGWTIEAEKPNDLDARVFVFVRLADNRSASLRWRLAAGLADVPQIALPLDKKYLDQAQAMLRGFSQRLELAADQISAMRKTQGLPSDVRSDLSNRQKLVTKQADFSSSMLKLVAEANQLEGWLDGQVEVHAVLFEQSQDSQEPIMRFGKTAPAINRK